jgi:hypothetical protein
VPSRKSVFSNARSTDFIEDEFPAHLAFPEADSTSFAPLFSLVISWSFP